MRGHQLRTAPAAAPHRLAEKPISCSCSRSAASTSGSTCDAAGWDLPAAWALGLVVLHAPDCALPNDKPHLTGAQYAQI